MRPNNGDNGDSARLAIYAQHMRQASQKPTLACAPPQTASGCSTL